MKASIGLAVVIVAVFGGYGLASGDPALLLQPAEFLIIWGAAAGALVVATPGAAMRRLAPSVAKVFRAPKYTRGRHLDTLVCLHELFALARRDGVIGLEKHVEEPAKSPIFQRHKLLAGDAGAMRFIRDTLRLVAAGGATAYDVDQMFEQDLEALREHHEQPLRSLTSTADALPGLGIVAAVMGIVIAMGALGGPPAELGRKVAAALVGTFLGVFTCYGVVGPLAGALQATDESEMAYFRMMRHALTAFVRGQPPRIAIEIARRSIPHDARPGFDETEAACRKTSRAA